ncbi:hypothetical protein AX15_000383 [Amanita polypyramis BW_CC]|nr:hypothetical protein AX15_000383 [Amanita polypyramis BW_CC]
MPGRKKQPETTGLAELQASIPRIFDQVQISSANHQKNFVALHRLHTEAAQYIEPVNNGRSVKLTGERKFEEVFTLMITRVLPIKKGIGPADRIVKFIGGYVRFVNEKAAEEKSAGDDTDEDDEDEDTTASRFTARLLKFLLKGFLAKEKNVRYRVLCMVAEMVSHLGAIDEEIYTELRSALLDRIYDKENAVRVQVVISLAKLAGSEDPSEVGDGESVLDILLDTLAHDSSPEVRRAALLNMPLTPLTIPHILARTRDTDVTMRKLVYSAVLEFNALLDEEDHKASQKVRTKEENELVAVGMGEDVNSDVNKAIDKTKPGKQKNQAKARHIGPTHPRVLTIAQRELIVRNGLGDREPTVRAAAEALVGTWADVVNVGVEHGEGESVSVKQENPSDAQDKHSVKPAGNEAEEKAVGFLKLFDLENEVASDGLLSVLASRPDIYDGLDFGDTFWTFLTPERVFLARVFVDYCCTTKNMARLEATLPVVTALAFRIQEAYNSLVDRFGELEEKRVFLQPEALAKEEDEITDREFIIGEMLKLAVNLDYSDEIGRRKMFQLMREMLTQETLPERLLTKCLDVLRELSASERDLIRVVVEIIQDLRDPGDEDTAEQDAETEINYGATPGTTRSARIPMFGNIKKNPEDLTPEQRAHADETDLRCLSLCIGVLKRVNSKLEDNSTLSGVIMDLIVPAVQREGLEFRVKSYISLGLCSLIDRDLALRSFKMYFDRVAAELPEELKISVLEVLFDMLMVHEHDFLQRQGHTPQAITEHLIARLGEEASPKVKALLAIGMSKLVLCGMITDIQVVKKMIITYLSPNTTDNQELRQCLTFFFPVYCYSSTANQIQMCEIFLETFIDLNNVRSQLDEDEEMISAAQVATLFVDWTDPLKLSLAVNARGKGKSSAVDEVIQLDLAGDILKGLLDKKNNLDKEDKRVLTQMLNKLHVPEAVDDDKIRTLKLLIYSVQTRRPLRDAISNNALRKFDTTISKKFEQQLEGFSEEEYKKMAELTELFELLDDIIPEGDDADTDVPRRKGKKRRSESIATTSTEGMRRGSPASLTRDGRPQSKRRRLSSPMNDSGQYDDDGTPPPEKPSRTMPKRNATKKPLQPTTVPDDSYEDIGRLPKPRSSRKKEAVEDTEEQQLDEDISHSVPSQHVSPASSSALTNVPYDSIMDDSEEEYEVNESLLVGDD